MKARICSSKISSTKETALRVESVLLDPLQHRYIAAGEVLGSLLGILAEVARTSITLYALQWNTKAKKWTVEVDKRRSVQIPNSDFQMEMLIWAEGTPLVHYDLLQKVLKH